MISHVSIATPYTGDGHVRSAPKLIAADPAIELVRRWRAELAILRHRSPASDAAKALADCAQELVDAITAGHQVSVQLTLAEAHALSHIPASTLRWISKHKPDVIGARKREGAWYVDRSRFEAYLQSPSRRIRVSDGIGSGSQVLHPEATVALL